MELKIEGVPKTCSSDVHALNDMPLTVPARMYGGVYPKVSAEELLDRSALLEGIANRRVCSSAIAGRIDRRRTPRAAAVRA